MNKTLVSYFSASGQTKSVAEKIRETLKSDIFEIEPVEKYTDKDLDWMDKQSRSSIEMNDKNSRPQIKNTIPNIEEYNKVIIGFPVWWYTAPTIINTFIEENNLEGKDVYIFITSGSSSVDKSFNDLKETYPNINFISGKRFTSNVVDTDILEWIK